MSAIQRKAARINPPLVSSEKHAAQRCEKLRNSLGLNYKSGVQSGACERKASDKMRTKRN
jgi:hypothetical protein